MDKQAVLEVLNSLEVIEKEGGDSPYILVANTVGNREKLNEIGVTDEKIWAVGDEESFCILSLAANENLADDYENGKFINWGPITEEDRERIRDGGGTLSDTFRLLRALEEVEERGVQG